MHKESKSVLVICPTSGKSNSIVRSINSVLAQEYLNFFICIVDDSGKTGIHLNNFFVDNKIFYIKNKENIGQAASINLAINTYPDFDYYALIDDDDEWVDKNKLQIQIKALESDKTKFFSTTLSYIRLNGITWVYDFDKCVKMVEIINSDPAKIFEFNPIVHSSVVISRRVFNANLKYDNKLNRAQDIDLWYRILVEFPSALNLIESPLVLINKSNHIFILKKLKVAYRDSVAICSIRKKYRLNSHFTAWPILDFLKKVLSFSIKTILEILKRFWKKEI